MVLRWDVSCIAMASTHVRLELILPKLAQAARTHVEIEARPWPERTLSSSVSFVALQLGVSVVGCSYPPRRWGVHVMLLIAAERG